MRKLTVSLNIHFNDMAAESTDDAHDAVKSALVSMHDHCTRELTEALESIGAKDVRLDMVIY